MSDTEILEVIKKRMEPILRGDVILGPGFIPMTFEQLEDYLWGPPASERDPPGLPFWITK